jgi:polyhydroxyalkanoate synthesis regulator phasin
MPLLAAMPDPAGYAAIGWIVVSLAALVAMLNQGLKLLDRLKDKPPPGELRAEVIEKFVHRHQCEATHHILSAELTKVFGELGGVGRDATQRAEELDRKWQEKLERQIDKLDGQRRDDVKALYDKVNKVDREVGETKSSVATVQTQLIRIDEKLDGIIQHAKK